MIQPDAAKATTQHSTRRKSNLVEMVDQLARLCPLDLALVVRKGIRLYMYRSTGYDQWSLTGREFVCMDLMDIFILR